MPWSTCLSIYYFQGAGSVALKDLQQFMLQLAKELGIESCEIRSDLLVKTTCNVINFARKGTSR